MASFFAFRVAAQSILHEKWINLLSILTIASGLLISVLVSLFVYNIDVIAKKLPEKFSIMLYLREGLSQEELESIINTLRKDVLIENVKYISKNEALEELKTMLEDTAYVIEGLEGNPLLNSIEVKPKREAVGPETIKRLAMEMKQIEGVEEVDYREKFLSSLYSLTVGMRVIGIVFLVIMLAGMIFVSYSTVKILFYRRKEEIETFKLLGAKRGFIRVPFMLEGAVIGFGSGLFSLIGTIILYYTVFQRLSPSIPFFKIIIFPVYACLLLPMAGLLLGMAGAVIAVGRIRY